MPVAPGIGADYLENIRDIGNDSKRAKLELLQLTNFFMRGILRAIPLLRSGGRMSFGVGAWNSCQKARTWRIFDETFQHPGNIYTCRRSKSFGNGLF